ncbi:hypothetical protein [Palleronia sp.]|uniref:hypothetical protein n=1 Tax=Palleronia sp. TaxID=1940284 RepID=UPI0035C7E979
MKDTMIGVDLAKRVFQIHGASMTGEVKFRKKLTREQFRRLMSEQPACIVVFEACGSASYWAREMEELGHEAKLIAPQFVRTFVKQQNNDAADAAAIVIAARQPEMRLVAPKTAEQQAMAERGDRGIVFHGVSLLREVLAGFDTRHDTPPSQAASPIFRYSSCGGNVKLGTEAHPGHGLPEEPQELLSRLGVLAFGSPGAGTSR